MYGTIKGNLIPDDYTLGLSAMIVVTNPEGLARLREQQRKQFGKRAAPTPAALQEAAQQPER